MKQGIHPTYNAKCKVACACGHSFITGSTAPEIQVEICSACHPFYTGKQKMMDTAGRVDKFRERMTEAKKREESSVQRTVEHKEARRKAKEDAIAAQFGTGTMKLKDLAKAKGETETDEESDEMTTAKKPAKKSTKRKQPAAASVATASVKKGGLKK